MKISLLHTLVWMECVEILPYLFCQLLRSDIWSLQVIIMSKFNVSLLCLLHLQHFTADHLIIYTGIWPQQVLWRWLPLLLLTPMWVEQMTDAFLRQSCLMRYHWEHYLFNSDRKKDACLYAYVPSLRILPINLILHHRFGLSLLPPISLQPVEYSSLTFLSHLHSIHFHRGRVQAPL